MSKIAKRISCMVSFVLVITCIISQADVIFSDALELDASEIGSTGRTGGIGGWTEVIGTSGQIVHSTVAGSVDGHSAQVQGYGASVNSIVRTVRTTHFSSITLEVAAFQQAANYEIDNYLKIEVDTGSGYVTLLQDYYRWDGHNTNDTLAGETTSVSTGEIVLDAEAANKDGIQIRITASVNNAESYWIDTVTVRGTPMTTTTIFSDAFQLDAGADGSTGRTGVGNLWTNGWTEDGFYANTIEHVTHTSALDGHAMIIRGTNSRVTNWVTRVISTKGYSDIVLKLVAFQSADTVIPSQYINIAVDTGSGLTTLLQDIGRWDGENLVTFGSPAYQETNAVSTLYLPLGSLAENNNSVTIRLLSNHGSGREDYFDSVVVSGIVIPPSGTVIMIK